MTALFLPGYRGTIWTAARASISYLQSNLNVANTSQAKALARTVAATLKNATTALAVQCAYDALQTIFANLEAVVPLNLGLDANTQAFLQNRVNAIQSAIISLKALLVQPLLVNQALAGNKAAIPDPQYLEWLLAFNFETPPAGLTAATLASEAQAASTAWTTIANALLTTNVTYSGASYNTVVLMGQASQVVANALRNASPSSFASTSQLWNQLVAMPTIGRSAAAVSNDPTDSVAQQVAVIRYVMLNLVQQLNALIISLRQVVTSQLRLGTLRQGDSLMTFAARELNDYTAWREIATLNGLQPPYVSNVPGEKVASPGQQLFLPPPNTSTPLAPQTGPVASYITNYLGVDKFLGPLNEPMLPWTGDYQIISGYDNLRLSLGRRLQTTIGGLIYHSLFGSRIPPEIGHIASANELTLIEQYSRSALASDPRVNKVVSCVVTAMPNYAVSVSAVVLPNGLGQEDITVNEVIGPA